MSEIRILDSLVIDRIAAGEVVERPASVVKELVENSLDAGATRVAVQLEDAGVGRVEVIDDGAGMHAADVDLAFAQHATSKVRTVDDLDAIETMGFRGEALASIASVARVELTTGTGAGPGVRLRIDGGVRQAVEAVAWPRGTTIRVSDLFYNTPARRKNLKKPATELRHISQTVIDYALCRPDVYVSLGHGKRTLLAAPPVSTLAERVHGVLGAQVASHWLPIEGRFGSLQIAGGVTSPEHQRPNRNEIRWYVNQRPVSDYRLVHALVSAYETLLGKGRFPVSVIFLDMPVEDVDVNVHPRKAEVRFANPGAVYRAVRSAVRESLARHLPPPRIHAGSADAEAPRGGQVLRFHGDLHGASSSGAAAFDTRRSLPVDGWIVSEGTAPGAATEASASGVPSAATAASGGEGMVAGDGVDGGPIRGTAGAIRPLAQYANTYIVAADEKGLLIIDQHVAHERILYEQVLAQLRRRAVEAQHLLVPEMIELSAADAAVIESQSDVLESFGFGIEHFGGSSWAIRTAPAILGTRNVGDTVRALLESLRQGQGPEALEEAKQEVAASIACHAAVRANHPLAREEMVRLIADLERCESPTRCPHGRPVLVRVEHDDLERRIGRH